jgi:iron(III) transport system substrate-binding protein
MRAVWGMIIERGLKQTGDTGAGFQWLRRLDAQTKEYVLNGPLLDQKLVRREGLVTIWDLPDILLSQRDGLQLGYRFPRSGTPVIEDAVAVVRHARHDATAQAFVEYVGSVAAQLLAARVAYRLPARRDLPTDSLPVWVRAVRREMEAADVDWDLLAERGADWMRYWDATVRGKGG